MASRRRVGDVRGDGPEAPPRQQIYVPLADNGISPSNVAIVVRTVGRPDDVLPAVQAAIRSVNPDQRFTQDMFTLDQYFDRMIAPRRFNMALMGIFGAFGLVIAAIGIYGVLAFTVAQRTREIGVRIALGASSRSVIVAVATRLIVVVASGLTVGGLISWLDAFGFTVGDTRISAWSLIVVVVVVVGLFLVARVGSRVAHRLFKRLTGLDPGARVLGEKLLSIVIWTFAILVGVDILGIDLTALTVFSGAFGLAVGFGLQKTFGNLLAGIILLMDRSIKPGDVIAVNDPTGRESFGQIRKIGIRAISVVTRDRKEYLIPNENLMVNQVVNWSYSSREVRVKAPVGVSYDDARNSVMPGPVGVNVLVALAETSGASVPMSQLRSRPLTVQLPRLTCVP